MKRWNRVKQPDHTKLQKTFKEFVLKLDPLRKQLEDEAKRLSDALEAHKETK